MKKYCVFLYGLALAGCQLEAPDRFADHTEFETNGFQAFQLTPRIGGANQHAQLQTLIQLHADDLLLSLRRHHENAVINSHHFLHAEMASSSMPQAVNIVRHSVINELHARGLQLQQQVDTDNSAAMLEGSMLASGEGFWLQTRLVSREEQHIMAVAETFIHHSIMRALDTRG